MGVVSGGGGGAAFNGGTIANPLNVAITDQSGSSIPLVVKGVGPVGDFDEAFRVTTSANANVLQVDSQYMTLTGHLLIYQSGSDVALQVDAGGGHKLVVDATGQIGLFGHAPSTQPTLTSGTATPEQIALALQTYGAAGGT